jgi:hypothetical protein
MATIDPYVRPPELYRYRSLKKFDREIEAIERAYLFCAAFTTLNDPMEGLFSSSTTMRASEDYYVVKEAILDSKFQLGMCSFSEVHNHELMWAHYADQFRGICVAYSFPMLLKHLAKGVRFVRMFYNETEPTIRSARKPVEDQARMILSYKNYRWLYEREWRMFTVKGRVEYGSRASVTKVYLGSRVADYDRQRIIDRLRPLGIEVHGMTINKYSISFDSDRRHSL